MKEKIKKRLDQIEQTEAPAKSLVIGCYLDDNLDELIAKWKAEGGVSSPDKPLIILKIKSRRLP